MGGETERKCRAILKRLKSEEDPECVKHMARYGMNPKNSYGISITFLKAMAKEIETDHELALHLWRSGIRDARLLATMVADPELVTEEQMENWVADFDSWDVCDQCCANLFDKTGFAYAKAHEWSERNEEFVKRAGFVLMAALAVHDKKAPDRKIEQFFPVIKREALDDRNYVKKAVNWALRQVGKRNLEMNKRAIVVAREIHKLDSRSAKWIASDALRELRSDKVRARLRRRKGL